MDIKSSVPAIPTANGKNLEGERSTLDSLHDVLELAIRNHHPQRASTLLNQLADSLRASGVNVPPLTHSPYVNSIAVEDEPAYPGDRVLEKKIKSYTRWNAMAMVVKANRVHTGLGGHISTYASCATFYEVGFNHFWRAKTDTHPGDFVYFQGHAAPGVYARAFVEKRLSAQQLGNFRQEFGEGGGLTSYPHPYLMPDFWQFPTVSMGLGPINSIYNARFLRYMEARKLADPKDAKVWCLMGDGECDEPESLGAITQAGRENLDNLVWVINCNLQRLDGPVRGNGKIIQELEGLFRGAGWRVIKVIWGSDWDALFQADKNGLLLKRMEEVVDGDFQKYSAEPGSYTRKHFFGKYPELMELVNHLSDEEIQKLLRGGHDPIKVYAAFKAATETKGQPTVILCKTVKGYGLGEAGEGRNITHQQKKLNEKELREFRKRFNIPISDEEIAETPFTRPADDSPEMKYLLERRKALGGFIPARYASTAALPVPDLSYFPEVTKGSGTTQASTTMAFVRILTKLLRHKQVGRQIVPIIPDEARTFGMDALFREIGIYSSKGQLYEPVDKESLLYYQEAKDGQILEEGITEAGSMASFIASGSSYATLGVPTIPFYIYYSMFGFQRVGDQIWAAADTKAKGFLLGATAGRTTLAGEGLQHQDGHSLIMASTVPTLLAYDPAFGFEIATIITDGLRRMYVQNEDVFYYITLGNENYAMPPMPEGCQEGILKGLYKFRAATSTSKKKAHIFGSGSILRMALKAQEILEKDYGVAVDVWSATSYKQLRSDALHTQRWNMFHPTEDAKQSYLEKILEKEKGTFVAVSDYMRIIPDQIAPWVPGGLFTLGTDGFGRSETRNNLRRYFEIDAECTVVGTLYALARKNVVEMNVVQKAIQAFGLSPEKIHPFFV